MAKMSPQQAMLLSNRLFKEAEKMENEEKMIVKLDAVISEDCEYRSENSKNSSDR